MKSLVKNCSKRRAMKNSSTFRVKVVSERSRNTLPTYCWVMVEPPWLIPPAATLLRAARRIALRSAPSCS